MTAYSTVFAVVFAGIAVSYGWGIRGFIIGGEKGALLPGALLGMSISLFCCDGALREYLPFFCAAGALSVFYGGTEPYAQTMSYILNNDFTVRENRRLFAHGAAGIFLKGALWFGLGAGVLALLPGAIGGIYKKSELAVLFALIPLLSFLGTKLFNSPYSKEKKLFPKIYFSDTSREEWGGNALILASICIFAAVKSDIFTLGAVFAGIIFGGFGFLFGLLIYDYVNRPHKGKRVFGRFNEKGYIDGWKIMEHFFGAFAGGGVTLYFCICANYIKGILPKEGLPFLLTGKNDTLCAVFCFVFLLLTAVQYPVSAILKKRSFSPEINLFEVLERPFWSAFPLIFVFLGSTKAAYFAAFITLAYALTEKCVTEWYADVKNRLPIYLSFGVFFAVCCIYFTVSKTITPEILILLYTAAYTLPTLAYIFLYKHRDYRKSKIGFGAFFGSGITVGAHFVIQCAVIVLIFYKFAKL